MPTYLKYEIFFHFELRSDPGPDFFLQLNKWNLIPAPYIATHVVFWVCRIV